MTKHATTRHHTDVIIIGAGAAGLMCALQASARGRSVLILEKSNKAGKKILMSGGGRCNFTNLQVEPENFVSHNQHFCKSALRRYTPADFSDLVHQYNIAYVEKTLGQLFCKDKSSQILNLLLSECQKNHVDLQVNHTIHSVSKKDGFWEIKSNIAEYTCDSLVIATGGLSIPSLGSSPFGYQIADQFGLLVRPTRAGLVPLTLHTHDKQRFAALAGVSVSCMVQCNGQSFYEQLLFTHRGLSGPAILQISSYWQPGDIIEIKLIPEVGLDDELLLAKKELPASSLKTILSKFVPKSLLGAFYTPELLDLPMKQLTVQQLRMSADILQRWYLQPNGTEGYRTAEVTLGGVDCNEISSQSFEAKKVSKLFFIGEVLDVSGWLGGYNFQWAWSSGWAAGQVV